MKYIFDLNKRLKRGKILSARAECQWNHFLEKVFLTQDILRNRNNSEKSFVSITKKRQANSWIAKVEWIYYVRLRQWLFRLLSIFCILLSLCIIWSEVTLFAVDDDGNKKFSVFALTIHDPSAGSSRIEVCINLE